MAEVLIRGGCFRGLLLRIYLAGYAGYRPPRLVRRLLAGSPCHRAWLLGFKGFFIEAGVAHGPANPSHDVWLPVE